MIEALSRVPRLRLLLATQSDPAPLLMAARRAGVTDRITVGPLDSEIARVRAHAAADLVVVPRRSPGGLPIKLLDAMARGVPCLVTPLGSAGLPLGDAVERTANDSGEALASAVDALLSDPDKRQRMITKAYRYMRREHSDTRFLVDAQ